MITILGTKSEDNEKLSMEQHLKMNKPFLGNTTNNLKTPRE